MHRRTLFSLLAAAACTAPAWAQSYPERPVRLVVPYAPAGTPQPIVDRLHASLNQVLATGAVQARMAKEGFDPLPSTVGEARQRLATELPRRARLTKERGITAE
ncbi:MAG: tripartite tricarboxylate transporter substrate-binding protein [Pseudorhodoferax sp.]